MATRCCSPPESVSARRSANSDETDLGQALLREGPVRRREAPDEARPLRDVAEPARQHVVEHGGAADQVELLEDHADLTADLTEGVGLGAGDRLAGHAHRPGGRLDEAIDRAEEGRLARPAGPDDHDELAGLDDEVDPVEGDRVRGQHHPEPLDLDHGLPGERPRGRVAGPGRQRFGRQPSRSMAARTGSYSRSSAGSNPSMS